MKMAEYIDHMGDDMRVANVARVSMNKWKTEFDDKDKNLLNYLATHEHTSPFRHAMLSVRISAPIFVARQLHKHQVGMQISLTELAHNEVSRRYVDDDPQFWIPDEWRMRPDKSIKQGSSNIPMHPELQEMIKCEYERLLVHAAEFYKEAIDHGVAPELARAALPQSMLTSWIWTGSLHAWLHLYDLRIDTHSQKETQEFAQEIGELLETYFPESFRAWRNRHA